MLHKLPSEFATGITDYKQYVNILLIICLSCLVARVKNHRKEINSRATINFNTIRYIIRRLNGKTSEYPNTLNKLFYY